MAELTAFYKTPAGAPLIAPTDAPEIQVIRIDTQAVVQAFTAMTDQGDGNWSFNFTPVLTLKYSFTTDGDPNVTGQVSTSNRYQGGSFDGLIDIDNMYIDGVWIDTVGNGAAGTVPGVNGTQHNPVDNWADAAAIATALNVRKFQLRGSLTLTSAFPSAIWRGLAGGGVLNPGGFDVGGGIFNQVGLTGSVNVTSGGVFGFQTSLVGPVSGVVGVFVDPGISGTITAGAGLLTLARSSSLVPGLSTPIIDLNGVASLNLRRHSGGIDLRGSSTAPQNTSLEISEGQCILDASNTAGVIAVRGWPGPFTDNSAGATVDTQGLGEVLVQNAILTDATPFPGANINVPISTRATQASVDNIQNNTRFQGIVPSILIKPQAGTTSYRFFGRLYDTAGSPADPDANTMNIRIEDSAGGVVIATVAMTRTGIGLYQYDYVVAAADPERQLNVFFEYLENAIAFQQVRTTLVQEFEGVLAIIENAVVNDIPADIAALQDISIGDVQTALTNQGYTAGRAPNLDNLDVAVSTRNDIADVLTALTTQGYTVARAANLDNLDAAISSLVGQGLTAAQAAQLQDMWRIWGLDSTTPLQVRITTAALFVEPVGGGAAVIQIDFTGDGITSSTGVRSV